MHAYEAYKQAQNLPATRIDLILELYRVALDSLEQARHALIEDASHIARRLLLKGQMAILGLASGLPAHNDELASTFLRLYEFASYEIVKASPESVAAAVQVVRTLYEGFLKVRDQAVSLELQGEIRPLSHDHLLSLKA